MQNESLWMKNKPLCIIIIAVLLFSVFILPWAIVLLQPDHSAEIESILSKYQKDERYVIVYLDETFRFSDHGFDIKEFKTNLKFSNSYYFIDSSLVYFYGSKNIGDKCIVELFSCDHYGKKLSMLFEKSYKKDSLSKKDCALHGYNFYIKHHSGNKEDKSSYALDVYNIETGEFKTMLSGEQAYNFQVEVNMYQPPQNSDNVVIDEDLVFKNALASELKKYGLKYLRTYYRNDEIYVFCNIWTKSYLFNIYFKYNEQTEQLDYLTWTNGGGEFPSAILKIDSQ